MLQYLRKIKHKALKGRALLRLDFNTEDDWRIKAVLPTIKFLLRVASKIVILSHRGRPKGYDPQLSLKKDGLNLQKLIGRRVRFVPDLDFQVIREVIKNSPPNSTILLQNLRFWKGEEANDPVFAKHLASLVGDFYPHTKRGHASSEQGLKSPRYGVGVYVNDAFAVCHRANASVSAITRFLPSYAGLELEKEIKFLSGVMKNPRRPLVLIVGGAKAGDKLGILKYFKNKADNIILGGALANTILYVAGFDVKKSLIDRDPNIFENLREVLKYDNLEMPVDYKWSNNAILDIGAASIKDFESIIGCAKTIIWNGPMGLFEKKPYDKGTLAVAKAIVRNKSAFSLSGGGETVAFLKKHGLDKKFSFISTGGGAMLEFLAGKKLPGIKALNQK